MLPSHDRLSFRDRLKQALLDGKISINDARSLAWGERAAAELTLDILERLPPPA